jgi:hypothetical protein
LVHRATHEWQVAIDVANEADLPTLPALENYAEYHEMVDRLEARSAAVPGMRAAHESLAGKVDECVGILMHTFVSVIWTAAW